MKRATKRSSLIFQQVLKQAEEQLFLAARAAANFQHRGIRGDERAAVLRQFLAGHLPNIFATGKGEAIDYRDARTGEIDLCVYDGATAAPIQASAGNALIPAEALYAVIEVKSVLTQAELDKCALAAKKVRGLRPFKQRFGPSPTEGEVSNHHRCIYIVFAYTSDLSEADWGRKEFARIKKATASVGGTMDLLDRVLVLDRGMIQPQVGVARGRDEEKGIFLEFYLHLVNFLMRERRRRPVIDWMAYASRGSWEKLS